VTDTQRPSDRKFGIAMSIVSALAAMCFAYLWGSSVYHDYFHGYYDMVVADIMMFCLFVGGFSVAAWFFPGYRGGCP
jgi:hypothetical protein